MTRDEKFTKCKIFFEKLAEVLSSDYEVVGSCNVDKSVYLIPKGTKDQITYYGKPSKSFRLSDHWNWYSNLEKCSKEYYIQCLSVNMPRPNSRPEPGMASKPKLGDQVAIIGDDGKYHCAYGEIFDRKTKKWGWIESTPEEVAANVIGA